MSAIVDLPLLELRSDTGETVPVEDPSTGEHLADVPRMGETETRRALEAAAEAFSSWRRLLARERGRILRDWAQAMMDNQEALSRLLTLEQGILPGLIGLAALRF